VCVDDEWGQALARSSAAAGVPVTTMATAPGVSADWLVDLPAETGADTAFILREVNGERSIPLVSHLPGTFNIANTALAALGLLTTGLGVDEITWAMAVPADVPGRMEIVSAGGPARSDGPRCIVDFAHTPDAVDAALAALRPSTAGRLVVVLGAGGDRDSGKRSSMGAAAARHADVVVVTDDNPRSEQPAAIRSQVMAGARAALADGTARATELIDGGGRAQAIAEAIALTMVGPDGGSEGGSESGSEGTAAPGVDTVVVLGKGHEKGQEISGVKYPFDDREAVRAALEAALSVRGRS
jgi:UDP-N-acetylmuramoyl-L-alanyl-D-glutamate--2,6-diaminopimelate ligase